MTIFNVLQISAVLSLHILALVQYVLTEIDYLGEGESDTSDEA
jgi:hypothetical protein